MDLNAPPTEPVPCSICWDPVVLPPSDDATRAVAVLKCRHNFHLDCIGSAFNARGTMQCPNCRDTEDGNWLDANRFQPSTDNGVTWERYPLSNFLTQSPVGGTSIPISSGIEGGGPTAGLSNIQVPVGTEPRNSEMQQPYFAALRMVHLAHRPTNTFGVDVQRYAGSSQQRPTQTAPQSHRSTSLVSLGPLPAFTSIGHGVQQTVPPATRSSQYPPTSRRVRPRVLSMASSSIAAYTAEDMEEAQNSGAGAS